MNNLTMKILVWHGLVALFAWRLLTLGNNFKFNSVTGLDIQLPSFFWFLLIVASIGLGYILFHNRLFSVSVSVIVGILFLIFFGFTWLNFLSVIIFWLCNVWAQERTYQDFRERLKINMQRMLTTTIMPVVLGFFIMASFAAYQSHFADQVKEQGQLPGQTQIFFREVIDKVFGSKLGAENTRQRQEAVNVSAFAAYKSVNDFLHPYFRWAPPVLAFGLLIILWGLSWIFIYAAVLVGIIAFWVLKKTRVVRIEEKDVKAEVLII